MIDSAVSPRVWPNIVALLAFNAFFRCAGYAMAYFNMRRKNQEFEEKSDGIDSTDHLDSSDHLGSTACLGENAAELNVSRRRSLMMITNQYDMERQLSCHWKE